MQFEDRSVECHTIAELCNVYPDEAPKPQYTSNIWETRDMSEDEDDEEFCIKAPAACGVKRATRSNTQVYPCLALMLTLWLMLWLALWLAL